MKNNHEASGSNGKPQTNLTELLLFLLLIFLILALIKF